MSEATDFMGKPHCDRVRFSKRQRPASKRLEWCKWCRGMMKGDAECPVKLAIASMSASEPTHD